MVSTDADTDAQFPQRSSADMRKMCDELFGSSSNQELHSSKPVTESLANVFPSAESTLIAACTVCGRSTSEYCKSCNLHICSQHSCVLPAQPQTSPVCFKCYRPEMMTVVMSPEACLESPYEEPEIPVHELISDVDEQQTDLDVWEYHGP